jgi:hypothetical protein
MNTDDGALGRTFDTPNSAESFYNSREQDYFRLVSGRLIKIQKNLTFLPA